MKSRFPIAFVAALAIACCAAPARAQLPPVDATKRPACVDGRPWTIWLLNESSASDCDAIAGGTSEAFCCCKDGSVAACAGAGGGGNSFETMDAPSGTDPVADSTADTLHLTAAGGITITGNSGTDTVAFDFASAAFLPAVSAPAVDAANGVWGVSTGIAFEGSSADANETTVVATNPTADRTLTLPNETGTVLTTASNYAASVSAGGPATTATAFVANPGDCSVADGTEFAWRINTTGDLSCVTVAYPDSASVILDIGDDGGNDSTAVTEIATVSDDYNVITEPTADKALIDFAKIAPYREYDPNRPSANCWGGTGALCEEFQNGGESLTWRWGNQGTSTLSFVLDRAMLVPQSGTTTLRARWITPPAAANWTMTTKFSHVLLSGTALAGGGPVVLETGSEATPTSISGIFLQYKNSLPWGSARAYSKTSYTSASTAIGTLIDANNTSLAMPVYAQIRYVTGTKTLTYYVSYNGLHFYAIGSARVLGAGPVSVGYAAETSGASTTDQTLFEWWRLRTDSAGTSGNYECGE